MSKSKNDLAWEKIFDKHQIINALQISEYFLISANDINKFREARLMTKFDHRSQLPKLFVDNKLSILPVSRGSYVIGEFESFYDFTEDNIEIKKIHFPHFLESLNYQDITSEATAINCAFIAEIIQDFTEEHFLYPTVSGRMSSSSFDFSINLGKGISKLSVNNSQVEIDGGYEGSNSLNIIEAKNYISEDFLVRQLFYPYRLWTQKINKKVRPIFLTYTNGIFHFREYEFTNNSFYNSLQLIKQKKYVIQDGIINIEIIQKILGEVTIKNEPEIPFPQADSFNRVINLCELLHDKITLTKEEITQNYDFDARQTDYYSNAGRYLGLLECERENDTTLCYLTERGRNLFKLSIFYRQIEFAKLILSYAAFNNTLKLYFENGNIPAKQEIIKIMRSSNLWNIDSESTYLRRSSTIISWINWIIDLIEE
jgi:hypothetical protein